MAMSAAQARAVYVTAAPAGGFIACARSLYATFVSEGGGDQAAFRAWLVPLVGSADAHEIVQLYANLGQAAVKGYEKHAARVSVVTL